jgi:hypothetical protein
MINSKVAKETLADVGIGLIISFPIAFYCPDLHDKLRVHSGCNCPDTNRGFHNHGIAQEVLCATLFFKERRQIRVW